MRTSAGRGDAGEALSVRAARLLHTRSRFHRDQTSVEPDGDAKGYLGENGGTGAVPSLIIWDDTEIVLRQNMMCEKDPGTTTVTGDLDKKGKAREPGRGLNRQF